MESGQDHIQVDSKGNGIINQGKSYNLLDLIYDMVTNRKGLLSFNTHLYNFLNTLNFPKSRISNRQILKKLNEHTPSSSTILKHEEEEDNFKSILENTSTPSGNTDLTMRRRRSTPLIARQKRRRINSTSTPPPPPTSIQKGIGQNTTCLSSKWLKF
jgi:hypothetical protein